MERWYRTCALGRTGLTATASWYSKWRSRRSIASRRSKPRSSKRSGEPGPRTGQRSCRVSDAVRLVASAIRSPALDAESLARAKRLLGAESNRTITRVLYRSFSALLTGLYGLDPILAEPITGLPATLARFTELDVKHYYAKRYGPANSALVAVGKFDREALVGAVRAGFGDWRPAEVEADVPEFPAPALHASPASVFAVSNDSAQARILIGVPCVGSGDPDELTFGVISSLLAQGLHSRPTAALLRGRR